jgi:hypothetical protein
MKTLFLTTILALGGCATTTGPLTSDQQQVLESSCAAASAALKVLTVVNEEGKLSEGAQADILAAAQAVQPVCGADEPPTLNDLQMTAFQQAVALLATKAMTGE